MTTLHDDTLRSALHDAAAGFAVPSGGAEQILEAARSAPHRARGDNELDDGSRARSWSRGRIAMVAAVAIVLVVLASSLSLAGLGTNRNSRQLGSHSGLLSGHGTFGVALPDSAAQKLAQSGKGLSFTGNRSAATGNPIPPTLTQQTKVVSVGAVSITVVGGDFNRVLARISSAATSVGGYVSSSRVTAGAGSSGTVELRIPQKQFNSVVATVERMGHVVSAVTNSTDVTGQYVDYQSRIGALQASRSQYLAIMARATSIGDILAIQAQVNVIETQIEQLEGQRNLLVNQAAYGTLTVSINQGLVTHASGVRRAWNQSISGFVAGIEWLIRATGPALFALLCLAALLLLGRFGWRASQRRLI